MHTVQYAVWHVLYYAVYRSCVHALSAKSSIGGPLFQKRQSWTAAGTWQVVAEAQLFMTLFLSVILRVSAEQLDADALSEDECGAGLRDSSISAVFTGEMCAES